MTVTRTIRLHHTDAAGVVFFERFFELAHDVYEEWLDAVGMSLSPDLSRVDVMTPVVHAEADFRAPLRLGDRVTIDVAVEAVGEKSYTMRYDMTQADGRPAAEVRIVHASMQPVTGRGVPIPDEWRAILVRARDAGGARDGD